MTATLPPLPALKALGDLRDRPPVIVCDTREQEPLPIARLPVIRGTLYTGDYSVSGLQSVFAVERKSIPDMVACCAASNRGRLENELHRLRGFHFRRLLVIGDRGDIERGAYRSNIRPAAVLGTLAAFEIRYDVPVVFEPDPAAAARRVETWAWYAAREYVETCNALFRGTREPATEAHG
jgi:DNA excision repair protein ERCC-4